MINSTDCFTLNNSTMNMFPLHKLDTPLLIILILVLLNVPNICIGEVCSEAWLISRKYFSSVSDSNGSSYKSGFVHEAVNDLKYGVRTTVSDFRHIYSSPVRWDKSDVLLAGGIAVLGGVIYGFDQEIYDMLNRNRNEPFYKPINRVGKFFEPLGYMGFTNKYLFLSVITGYIFEIEPLLNISADILESYAIAGVAKNGANLFVGRRRPVAGLGPRSYKFGDGTSFPSGHSLNIIQIASIVSYHFDNPVFKAVAYSVAASVCLQRITSSSHWPSDVYTGATLGWFISHELIKLKRSRKLTVTPITFGAQGGGVMVGFRF